MKCSRVQINQHLENFTEDDCPLPHQGNLREMEVRRIDNI